MKHDKGKLNQDFIGRLLRMAGPRPTAPEDRQERVREAVHAAWLMRVRSQRRRRWILGGGLGLAAASLMALLGVSLMQAPTPEAIYAGPVGRVEALSGVVKVYEGSSAGTVRELRVGDVLEGGDVIDTGMLGRAAIQLASGNSLRLDLGTRLRGLTDSSVALESGALYFDGGRQSANPVDVQTHLGIVRDIGTQYELRVEDRHVRVRVREGSIQLGHDEELFDAVAGVELRLDTAGELSRRSVPIYGPDWDWILAVAPPFDLEGKSLDVFLEWVSRETGWRSSFVDATVEQRAPEVVLSGSVAGMRPDQALDAVLPTCGLAHRLEGGILRIEAEGP